MFQIFVCLLVCFVVSVYYSLVLVYTKCERSGGGLLCFVCWSVLLFLYIKA